MDLSIASAYGILICLISLFILIVKGQIKFKLQKYLFIGFGVLLSFIYSFDSVLYGEWGYRIDNSIFFYLQSLGEASHFLRYELVFRFLFCLLILFLILYIIIKYFYHQDQDTQLNKYYSILLLFLMAFLIIPLRGGIGLSPLSPSWVYHSEKVFANHLAINPLWNLLYTLNQNNNHEEQEDYISKERSFELYNELMINTDSSSFYFLKNNRPDIFILFLESFTSNLLHRNYKGIEITPNLNRWLKKGIYFNQAYASGDRTDKGLPAVLSSFPAQPKNSIIKYSRKADKLSSIAKVLKVYNYSSSFYYGGDINFAGMKSYLLTTGFNNIIDKNSFNSSDFNAKWGVHDHILLDRLLADVSNLKSPFLVSGITLSSHSPYDIPVAPVFEPHNSEEKFVTSAHYTDQSLGKFLDQLSQSKSWQNMLMIIVADHGANFPETINYTQKLKFHIPILFTGGAVIKDTIISKVCSQTDILKTIFSQMNITSNHFPFSRNIFSNNYKPFAFYSFNNGLGWLEDSCHFVISHDSKKEIYSEGSCKLKKENAYAYYQKVMKEFNEK